MRTVAMVVALASAGCNQLLGLDPPSLPPIDASDEPVDARPDAAVDCTDPGGVPDEDGDLLRDACDNCPHRAQTTAADRADPDSDGIGAQCDPNLLGPDHVAAFLGFSEEVPSLRLITDGTGVWAYDNGDLVLANTAAQINYLAALDLELPEVTVEAELTVPTSVPPLFSDGNSHSLGVWANLDPTSPFPPYPRGNVSEIFERRLSQLVTNAQAHLVDTTPTPPTSSASAPSSLLFMPGARYHLQLTCGAGQCSTVVRQAGTVVFGTSNASNTRAGGVGLRAFAIDARFHYLMVYAPGM